MIGGTINATTAAIITAALGLAYNQVMAAIVRRIYAGESVSEAEMVALMKTKFSEQMKRGKELLKSGQHEDSGDE